MKREYMKPTVLVVKIQQRKIICLSPGDVQDVNNPDEDINWEKNGFGDNDLDM